MSSQPIMDVLVFHLLFITADGDVLLLSSYQMHHMELKHMNPSCVFSAYVVVRESGFEMLAPQTDLLHWQSGCKQVCYFDVSDPVLQTPDRVQTLWGLIYRSEWSESPRGRRPVSSLTAELLESCVILWWFNCWTVMLMLLFTVWQYEFLSYM